MTPDLPGQPSVDHREQDLRDHALLLVRAGLLDAPARLEEMVRSVELQLPDTDAAILARVWLAAAEKQVREASRSWDAVTDHDRLQSALAESEANGVRVLPGVEAGQVRGLVEGLPATTRGVLWFSPEAVHEALGTGVLNAALRLPDGSLPGPQDHLVTAVVACLTRHGLQARWYESQLQVATWWRRRP